MLKISDFMLKYERFHAKMSDFVLQYERFQELPEAFANESGGKAVIIM